MTIKLDELMPHKQLFNPDGDIEVNKRRMIGGNTTNLNDFNNMKYSWVSNWYRQAMNNFWIPEEINMNQDVKDYRKALTPAEKRAYDKILSFLIFLDSLQTANLPNIGEYITANEVNMCLNIQCYQETIHSQAYSYMLDTICSPFERNEILYQWKLKVLIANYILEGIYFYSGFMFFYNLARNNKMSGSVQNIRYINRDENTHLWLFRSIILELRKEEPELFTKENEEVLKAMLLEGCKQEIEWGMYIIGNDIPGLNEEMVKDYIKYLGNLRSTSIGLGKLFEGYDREPESMSWVSKYSDANMIKTDFFEARNTAYAKSSVIKDDL